MCVNFVLWYNCALFGRGGIVLAVYLMSELYYMKFVVHGLLRVVL